MIALDTRQALLALLCEACDAGARWARACAQIGLNLRTVQRWQHPQAQHGDLRASDQRKPCTPLNKLSEAERLGALELLNSAEFKDLGNPQFIRYPRSLSFTSSKRTGRRPPMSDYLSLPP